MTKRDFGYAVLPRPAIERAAPQPRTQATHRPALRDHAFDDRVGILLDDVERYAERSEVVGQNVLRKSRLFLIEIHRDEVERHRCTALQRQQNIEHRIRVFATRQTHHHFVVRLDHRKIGDGFADEPAQARL